MVVLVPNEIPERVISQEGLKTTRALPLEVACRSCPRRRSRTPRRPPRRPPRRGRPRIRPAGRRRDPRRPAPPAVEECGGGGCVEILLILPPDPPGEGEIGARFGRRGRRRLPAAGAAGPRGRRPSLEDRQRPGGSFLRHGNYGVHHRDGNLIDGVWISLGEGGYKILEWV